MLISGTRASRRRSVSSSLRLCARCIPIQAVSNTPRAKTQRRKEERITGVHMNDHLREQIARILDWNDAHAGLDDALEGIPAELRGLTAEGAVHSLWQLLEHMRLAQFDILDFCRNAQLQGAFVNGRVLAQAL